MDVSLKKLRLTLLVLSVVLDLSRCSEEYQREIFLSPRNFNPHPYEHQLAKIQDPGPVVFPAGSQEEPVISNQYNIITVDKAGRKYPIDITPYAKVAQKIKNFINRKYIVGKPSQIDSGDIYNALARQQRTKVVTYPPQELKSVNLLPNNYAFAYKVLDKATGDDFSHQQVRSSKATNGEYRVKLPDGRLQIVSYKADKNGYNADVRYEVDPEVHYRQPEQPVESPKLALYVPQKVKVSQVPVRQYHVSRERVKAYEYFSEEDPNGYPEEHHDNSIYFEEHGPTQIPVNYGDVPVTHTTPSPAYYVSHQTESPTPSYSPYSYQHPNVHIYTTNPRDHHIQGSYVATTAATPVYGGAATPVYGSGATPVHGAAPTPAYNDRQPAVRYTSTPAPPTVRAQVVHNGDHGLYQPRVVSSYAPPSVAQSALPGRNNVINTLSPGAKPSDAYRETLEKENELPEGIYIVGKPRK